MVVKSIEKTLEELKLKRDEIEKEVKKWEEEHKEDSDDRKYLDALNLAINLIEGNDD